MDMEKSVIIIDDEKGMLKTILPTLGIQEILTASDRDESIKAIDAIAFDLVILEIGMPYGIEILKYIKNKRPKAKVIVYSRCDYKTKKEAEALGIDEFLPKSVQIVMLLDAVQYVLKS